MVKYHIPLNISEEDYLNATRHKIFFKTKPKVFFKKKEEVKTLQLMPIILQF